jgi:hypothetical protein
MKKYVVFMMCAVLGAGVLSGCSDSSDNDFEKKSYISKDIEISGVNVDVRDRELEVSLSDDGLVHIDYFESEKEYYNIFVSDSKVLNITAADSKEWTDYIGRKTADENRKIYLQVPDAYLKTLSLSTTNDNVNISELTIIGEVSVSITGGDINFEKINVGNKLTLKAKNGDISGTVNGGYDDYTIESVIKKGKSSLPSKKEGGSKVLNVSNNNGDIDISFENN